MRRSITQSYLDVSMIFKKVREVIFRPAEKSVRQLHAVVLFTHGLIRQNTDFIQDVVG